jgi:DNA-binding MarR family transcriptional regulator
VSEEKLLAAIAPFITLRPRMPLRCLETLLLVALHPGESVTDLAGRAGLSVSTMSRNLRDLGNEYRTGKAGLKLVESNPHPANAASLAYRLTPRGRALLDKVLNILKGQNK